MTCTHIAAFARGPVRASWLAEDTPCGPRLPRTRSSSGAAYGPALITGPNLTPVGLPDIALLAWHREELATELAHLRRKHRSTSAVMADLQGATHAILAMGGR
jgi:hypothetical protein